jgi:hypothetical protein
MSQFWHLCPFKEIISHDGKKFEKIPAWRGKVSIVLVLINPAWWMKFGIVLILHGRRKL